MPGVDEKQGTFPERALGSARNGRVGIREFDEGLVRTMGATLQTHPGGSGDGWFLSGVPGVCPPAGYPGIPVIITQSDDAFGDYVMPILAVRPEPPAHAPQRWHSVGHRQYRTAAAGALPSSVEVNGETVTGYEAYEEMPQAQPTDFTYEIRAIGRTKGGFFEGLPRDQASTLFMHLLKRYSHHNMSAAVYVVDTVGDIRRYSCFLESMNSEVETSQLSDRVVQFSVTIRVEGELDITDPLTYPSVRSRDLNGTIL